MKSRDTSASKNYLSTKSYQPQVYQDFANKYMTAPFSNFAPDQWREREDGTAVLFDRGWVCPLEDFLHRPTIQDKYQIFVIDLEALMVFI